MLFFVGSVVFLAGWLVAEPAFAWGATTHLMLAEHVLLNRAVLPAALGHLLGQYPAFYAYGNIIADLILGKRFRIPYHDHSHNWQVGYKLLDEAPTPELKAAMWGYLSHLAADVVAHHVYIPTKLAAAEPGLIRGHLGWELAFDAEWPDDYTYSALELERKVGPIVDPFVMDRLRRTLFSHRTNKRIFSGTLKIQRIRRYRDFISMATRRAMHAPVAPTREGYLERSLRAIGSLTMHDRQADVLRYDPTGHDAIALAMRVRRQGQAGGVTLYGPDGRILELGDVRTQFERPLLSLDLHRFGGIDTTKVLLPEIVS